AVGDVDDAEQVSTTGGVVDGDEQLAEKEVFVGRGPEDALEHVASEESAPLLAHARSMSAWRSAKARSRTSAGTPARSKRSSSWSHSSWRSHGGQAASWSATDSG